MWFTADGGGPAVVGFVNPTTGAVTTHDVDGVATIQAVTAGPDGAMWFVYTEPANFQIGRVAGGVVTFRPGPNGIGVASGPDGNLWVSGYSSIYRFDPNTGVSDSLPLPPGSPLTMTIANGPDGNLWFGTQNSDKIGRITTSGSVALYTVPVASTTVSPTSGPGDGLVWFTLYNSGLLGRIDPASGEVALFTPPDPPRGAKGVVSGSDGNLWFQLGGYMVKGVRSTLPVNLESLVLE